MGVMESREPRAVWKYFEEICSIPHGSGNTRAISDYLAEFARKRGLEHYQDAANNVIIIKEASEGQEDAEPLIIQGHMDMVCEKTVDSDIDMEKDGLKLQVIMEDGKEYLKAEGTTLGADDGIAVAMGLALLDEKDLVHPRLELVVTVDEEIGMLGAGVIDLSMLKGRKLLNLDSEEGGIFITSCAGGVTMQAESDFETEEAEGCPCSVFWAGFAGGHSGADIHLGHQNSNRIAARVLYEIGKIMPVRICSMWGGTKDNVIPCYTEAEIVTNDPRAFEKLLKEKEAEMRREFSGSDGNMEFSCHIYSQTDGDGQPAIQADGVAIPKGVYCVLTRPEQKRFLNSILNLPNGVDSMSFEVENLVETSSSLGILELKNGHCRLSALLRSMRTGALHHLLDRQILHLENCGYTCRPEAEYHGWEYDAHSEIREIMAEAYEELFGKRPELLNLHAGLECGVLLERKPDLDCISMGPWIHDIHTVKERLDIQSTADYWMLVHRGIEKILERGNK